MLGKAQLQHSQELLLAGHTASERWTSPNGIQPHSGATWGQFSGTPQPRSGISKQEHGDCAVLIPLPSASEMASCRSSPVWDLPPPG